MTTVIEDDFRQAIESAGLTPPGTIIPDGNLHRFSSNGDSGDDAGWYVLFLDGVPAGAFGDWRTGVNEKWCAKSDRTLTKDERVQYCERIATAQRRRDEEEHRRHTEAAQRAQVIWDAASPANDDHPYLVKKRIAPNGTRLYRGTLLITGRSMDGALIIPMYDASGMLRSLEFITADGSKLFLPGGQKRGCFYVIGDLTESTETVGIGEGFATGASVHEAANIPVVIAFDAGNLKPVAEPIRGKYPDVRILILGDNDMSGVGRTKAREAAQAVHGTAVIPQGEGDDWNDVAVRDGLDTVRQQITAMLKAPGEPVPSNGGFDPMTLAQLLDEPEPLEPDWILEDVLPAGALVGFIAKPKVGKTTFAYELAVRIAKGQPFLGRTTKRGSVLILAMEEHRREVKRRLRNLDADQVDTIYVHMGPLTDSADTLHQLHSYIKQHAIVLVLFDTLNTFWSVSEENDAGAVTQALKPLLQLARETGATVLLIHHARKSEGEHGDEIRGSGALFSLLDVAMILKRHDVETQRRLVTISRFAESPPELLLELRDHGYVSLGDPAASSKAAKLTKMVDALADTPLSVKALAGQAGLPMKSAYTLLDLLYQQGRAVRGGTGKKGDPFVFSKFVSVSVPKSRGSEETNYSQPTLSRESSSPHGGFVSSYPSTIGVERKETNSGVVTDSFLPTPVPPGRNEYEEVIEI